MFDIERHVAELTHTFNLWWLISEASPANWMGVPRIPNLELFQRCGPFVRFYPYRIFLVRKIRKCKLNCSICDWPIWLNKNVTGTSPWRWLGGVIPKRPYLNGNSFWRLRKLLQDMSPQLQAEVCTELPLSWIREQRSQVGIVVACCWKILIPSSEWTCCGMNWPHWSVSHIMLAID